MTLSNQLKAKGWTPGFPAHNNVSYFFGVAWHRKTSAMKTVLLINEDSTEVCEVCR